jgi:hypothetical protein
MFFTSQSNEYTFSPFTKPGGFYSTGFRTADMGLGQHHLLPVHYSGFLVLQVNSGRIIPIPVNGGHDLAQTRSVDALQPRRRDPVVNPTLPTHTGVQSLYGPPTQLKKYLTWLTNFVPYSFLFNRKVGNGTQSKSHGAE